MTPRNVDTHRRAGIPLTIPLHRVMRMKIGVLSMRQRAEIIPRSIRVGIDTQPIPHRPIFLELTD